MDYHQTHSHWFDAGEDTISIPGSVTPCEPAKISDKVVSANLNSSGCDWSFQWLDATSFAITKIVIQLNSSKGNFLSSEIPAATGNSINASYHLTMNDQYRLIQITSPTP